MTTVPQLNKMWSSHQTVIYPGGEGAWDLHGPAPLLGCSLLSFTLTSSAIKNSWGEVNQGFDAAAVAISVGLCCGGGGGEAAPAEAGVVAAEMSKGYIVEVLQLRFQEGRVVKVVDQRLQRSGGECQVNPVAKQDKLINHAHIT